MGLLKNSLLLQGQLRHATAAAAGVGRRGVATSTEEYMRRNYANNVSEYNTVIGSLVQQRRPYLLRDAYDDMILDGVQPVRDTFHNLIVGTMKGSRMQDAFYFRDQMREMGLQPDVNLYNFLISTCGKCQNSDAAILLLEEMKAHGVKLKGETYICLLNALAATGRTDQVYAIVRDMTAAGLGLNKFCYAGLITAFKNKTPTSEDTTAKILEFVQQSKGWQYVERVANDSAENIMMNVSEEELYNLPTAEYAHRRGFIFKQLTIYHVAVHACADLRSKETLEALLDMLTKDGFTNDAFIVMHAVRCYLRCGDIDSAVKMFEEFSSSKPTPAELYVKLAEGAMIGYTPRGMQLAQETLEKMTKRNLFLNPKMGTDLLLAASGEKTGGYTTANYIWDLLQARKIIPALPAVEAYHKGLKEREIPSDDPRLLNVAHTLDNLQLRFGPRRNTQ
ncbi:pentatricopeptide repeat-containing protein At4g35850, mitochondrial [Brachypodium distachyon]|uniref:pentatricopeptide repeat-containing protein At4g35850, mitochondrial n=1 Tax=Brachypodium distachyon TaxID=15368 RepID=UPI0005300A07|nr:pentatricopeptide repeat-containing protein At4g35850, mitochondrial [Brachypodium distachyon]XP_010231721.1 pentatricopeptide repeat-containing protein At4g35850, mitochondrial [Brachypodium distachyon]|eukprot:XP_010231720.1 pentatricopeptide repeat-containing protein At4g35850, mitochondrial [Brachypodium distachyon]